MHPAHLSPVGGAAAGGPARRTLVIGPNWIGDAIMSMPAVLSLAGADPASSVEVLSRPGIAPLWAMAPAVEVVRGCDVRRGVRRTLGAARTLRRTGYDRVFILPNSLRSALVAFLARIPQRIGQRGHMRAALLTRVVDSPARRSGAHQSLECADVLGVGWDACRARRVLLRPSEDDRDGAGRHLAGLPARLVALLPGAARGPSKRWPAEAFAQVARDLGGRANAGVLILGGPGEEDLGCAVAGAAGPCALNLCGRLSLGQSVAVLARCALAVTNDSGGMHLAAAAGIRVVAVFGLTDPRRTGPLGDGHRIIRPEGVRGARDIRPDSAAAREALAGIRPECVTDAAVAVLEEA